MESVTTTIRRGQHAFEQAAADATAEAFHECRKRVKDLRYQLELLRKLWPDVIEGYADAAKELEKSLGDDHNLAVLTQVLGEAPQNTRTKTVVSLAGKRQAKLREFARIASGRLYSDSPKSWTHRLNASWKVFALSQ